MQGLCCHEEDEGRHHVHHHGDGGVGQARHAQQPAQAAQHAAHQQAGRDAAEEELQEGETGVCRREGARDGCGDGELEAHDAGCVVDEGLAAEQGLLARAELDVFAQGHHGGGVCGAQRRAQGKGGRQRDAGLGQVEGEAGRQRGDQHQPDGERDDGDLVAPQGELVHVLGLVVEQRCDEQQQEELRVERDRAQLRRSDRHRRPQGDLHQRQAEQRQDLVEHRRDQHSNQQEDDKLEQLQQTPRIIGRFR